VNAASQCEASTARLRDPLEPKGTRAARCSAVTERRLGEGGCAAAAGRTWLGEALAGPQCATGTRQPTARAAARVAQATAPERTARAAKAAQTRAAEQGSSEHALRRWRAGRGAAQLGSLERSSSSALIQSRSGRRCESAGRVPPNTTRAPLLRLRWSLRHADTIQLAAGCAGRSRVHIQARRVSQQREAQRVSRAWCSCRRGRAPAAQRTPRTCAAACACWRAPPAPRGA